MRALDAFTIVGAIQAAVDSGMTELLEEAGPLPTATLASRLHLDAPRTRKLVEALAAVGVLEHEGTAGWALTGTTADWRHLVDSVGSIARYLEGENPTAPHELDGVGAMYRSLVEIFSEMMRPLTQQWAKTVAAPHSSVLEIGAGAAPWTRALLDSEPTMRATIVDLDAVVARQLPRLTDDYPTATIEAIATDVFSLDLQGRTFDVIVASAFCRLFDRESNARLFARFASWLAPGGYLIVADAVDNPDSRERGLATYILNLATRSRHGQVYSEVDFASWMIDAGLPAPTPHSTEHAALSILVSRRPVHAA